jgi:hypothetical protein
MSEAGGSATACASGAAHAYTANYGCGSTRGGSLRECLGTVEARAALRDDLLVSDCQGAQSGRRSLAGCTSVRTRLEVDAVSKSGWRKNYRYGKSRQSNNAFHYIIPLV